MTDKQATPLERPPQPLPPELKAGLAGAVLGAAAVFLLGFFVAGWVTTSTAKEQAHSAVVAALAPICVGQARNAPNAKVQFAELRKLEPYQRVSYIAENGWATMPGATDPDSDVATACATLLDETLN